MLKLRSEGYTHLIVQSTNIIDGVEMESGMWKTHYPSSRNTCRYSPALLYRRCRESGKYSGEPLQRPGTKQESYQRTLRPCGHGTYTPSTAIYSQMDYMLKAGGLTNFHVGTIEGYPTFDTMLAQLKAGKAKRVTLIPFMFVAGDHAKNDIAGEWKEMLEKEGFTVSAQLEGLGQIPEIQEIFIDHIRFGLKHRMLDIMTKKAAYAAGKDTE